MDRGAYLATAHGVAESDTAEWLSIAQLYGDWHLVYTI